jgi:hypothetical protein
MASKKGSSCKNCGKIRISKIIIWRLLNYVKSLSMGMTMESDQKLLI